MLPIQHLKREITFLIRYIYIYIFNFVILKLKLLGKKRAKLPLMGTELQYKITYYENT